MTAPDREKLAARDAIERVIRHHLPVRAPNFGPVLCICDMKRTYDGPIAHRLHVADALLAGPLAPVAPAGDGGVPRRTYTADELRYLIEQTDDRAWSRRLACPTCGAEPWQLCLSPSGNRSSRSHNARTTAVENLLLDEFHRARSLPPAPPPGDGLPEGEACFLCGKPDDAPVVSTTGRHDTCDTVYDIGRNDEAAEHAPLRSAWTALLEGLRAKGLDAFDHYEDEGLSEADIAAYVLKHVTPPPPGDVGEVVERVRAWAERIGSTLADGRDGVRFTLYEQDVADLRALLAAVSRLTAEVGLLKDEAACATADRDAWMDRAFAPPATFDEVSPSQEQNARDDFAGRPTLDELFARSLAPDPVLEACDYAPARDPLLSNGDET